MAASFLLTGKGKFISAVLELQAGLASDHSVPKILD